MLASSTTRRLGVTAGVAAAVATLPVLFAYRFTQVYRLRAGFPKRHPPILAPDALGLQYLDVAVPTVGGVALPGWFIPAGPDRAPGVVLVHGWESARDRALPFAQFLGAAGFHTLVFDVRGHGGNAAESRPLGVGEFADDAAAAARWLAARSEVTRIALLGHSMGGAGALLAAAAEPAVSAVVAVAAPADPVRLTRQTFRLAELPIPGPVAWPLAWLATRALLRPRGRTVASVSASEAVKRIAVPALLVHGDEDRVVPVSHLARLAAIRRAARPRAVTQTLVIHEGRHSWQYESVMFRSAVARFLAASLDGPLDPEGAARVAAAVPSARLPEPDGPSSLDEEPGGLRSLLRVFGRTAPTGVARP